MTAGRRASSASVDKLLRQITDGEGYPHKLLTDKGEAARLSHLVESLDRTATELNGTLSEVRELSSHGIIRGGQNRVHVRFMGAGSSDHKSVTRRCARAPPRRCRTSPPLDRLAGLPRIPAVSE